MKRSRSRVNSKQRGVAVALIALGAFLALVGSALGAKQPGLDRSFADGGVLTVGQRIPGYDFTPVEAMAAAPGGASYVLQAGSPGCAGPGCIKPLFLIRYRADGSIDERFKGPFPGVIVTTDSELTPSLYVDAKGRPVVALRHDGELTLRRYGIDGQPDAGFGEGGKVTLDCGCFTPGNGEVGFGVAQDREGRILVTAGAALSGPQYGGDRSLVRITRLREDGTPDSTFGTNGVAELRSSKSLPWAISVAPSGAIYLQGSLSCCKAPSISLFRVSSRGRLDTRFDKTVARTLRRTAGRFGSSVNTRMVLRPHGRIDLFSSVDFETGTALRLRPNGTVQPRFGRNGVRKLPFRLHSVSLDEAGGTFGIAEAESGVRLVRLLPSDRIDVGFGGDRGFEMSEVNGEGGVSVESLRGNRAMVLDLGREICRFTCEPKPNFLRYLDPGAKGRQR